jgi:GMP synthase (glutamine-hydrolysing)
LKPVLIVKTGTTVPSLRERRGDFELWIEEGLELGHVEVVSVYEGDALPDWAQLAGAVVTGSSALVSEREDWSERTASWLATAVETGLPLLGICYGHQLLAHACGGEVGANPLGREIGTVDVRFDACGDALLGALADEVPFQATHVESVLQLPPGARRLATTDGDPNHAFALGDSAWGVQFHPEFDADVMRGYLVERSAVLADEGLDAATLAAAVRDTPAGPQLLAAFGRWLSAQVEETGRR